MDLSFLFDDQNDEKQSKTEVAYETIKRIDKTITTIDYRNQDNKFIEDEIRERILINVTPEMKELLTKIDNLNQLDYLFGEDDDILDLTSKFQTDLRDEVLQNINI